MTLGGMAYYEGQTGPKAGWLERRCFCFWREIHLPIPASDFLARADTVIAAELSGVSHFKTIHRRFRFHLMLSYFSPGLSKAFQSF